MNNLFLNDFNYPIYLYEHIFRWWNSVLNCDTVGNAELSYKYVCVSCQPPDNCLFDFVRHFYEILLAVFKETKKVV